MGAIAGRSLAGYEELKSSAAFLPPDPAAELLEVRGPDSEKFLQAMLTQHIAGLSGSQGKEAAVLDREGRILGSFAVFARPGGYLLRVEEGRAETVRAFLEKYKIAAKVEISPPKAVLGQFSLGGRLVGEALSELLERKDLPESGPALVDLNPGHPNILIRWDRFGFPCWESWLEPECRTDTAKFFSEKGWPTASEEAVLAHRIESRRPYLHGEEKGLIPNDLPQLENMVSFSKGCFPGQEVVIRIKHRGQPGHRLVLAKLDGEKVPSRGLPVLFQGQEAGKVMASAYCPALGGIGFLGLIKRVPGKPGNRLELPGYGSAEVVG